eukprot:gene32275-41829_t
MYRTALSNAITHINETFNSECPGKVRSSLQSQFGGLLLCKFIDRDSNVTMSPQASSGKHFARTLTSSSTTLPPPAPHIHTSPATAPMTKMDFNDFVR